MSQSPTNPTKQPGVTIDFLADFEAILRATLQQWQVAMPDSASRDDVIIGFYDAQRRRIPPAPRNYRPAPDLVVPHEVQAGYEALVIKIKSGDDLSPHLSTLIERTDRPDGLLIDWNIYHLHLSELPYPRNPRFVDRTGPLLYVMVTADSVYGLAIAEHGSWASFELLEVAHRHFPEVMAPWRAHESIVGLSHVPSEEEVLRFRKAGIVSMLQLSDGTIYHPPGMGLNSTGRTSVWGSVWRNNVVRKLHAFEEHMRTHAEEFANTARAEGFQMVPPYHFRLHLDGDRVVAVEQRVKVGFQIGTLN